MIFMVAYMLTITFIIFINYFIFTSKIQEYCADTCNKKTLNMPTLPRALKAHTPDVRETM